MRKYFTGRNSEIGDTIIEVLIVLAVLSLAFVISYATANRGLLEARNADEHSEALGLIDSQVEELRADFDTGDANVTPNPPTQVFCMSKSTAAFTPFVEGSGQPNPGQPYTPSMLPTTSSADSAGGYIEYPSDCKPSTEPYHVSIVYVPVSAPNQSQSYYDFLVRWDGVGNLGPQQEELTYKLSAVALTGNSYIDGSGGTGCTTGCGPSYQLNWTASTSGWPPYSTCFQSDSDSVTDPEIWNGCNGADPLASSGCGSNGICGMVAFRSLDAPYYFVPTPSGAPSGPVYVMDIYYNQYGGQPSATAPNSFPDPNAGFSVPLGGYNFNVSICAPIAGQALNLNTSCIAEQLPVSTSPNLNSQYSMVCYPIVLSGASFGSYSASNYPSVQIDWTNNDAPPGDPRSYWDPTGTPPIDPNLEIDYIKVFNYSGSGYPTSCP